MEEEVVNSYLTFKVNTGFYGVHVSKVVEILAYEKPQTHAGSVPYILGLMPHRERVVPLIDSGLKFDVGQIVLSEQSYVIVISVAGPDGDFDVALAVDEVREVVDIPVDGRKSIDSTYKPGYVDFVAPTNAGLVIALNTDMVFTDAEVVSMGKLVNVDDVK